MWHEQGMAYYVVGRLSIWLLLQQADSLGLEIECPQAASLAVGYVQFISGVFEHSMLHIIMGDLWFVWPIDCNVKTQHFPKHKFPVHTTRNIQTQLKSTVTY